MVDQPQPGADPGEPFQSLYRRYRPQRFGDVKGQEHLTRALRNAVRSTKVAHAYLFSGPRGTGKTSTARILAMALNCADPVDGEPDGTCASCVEIRRGSSLDVHELDAASNRKLDEMRELLGRVALGTPGRWKVYIVDEVHQLTPDAASALLKTLEEPPGHVVFVLATTDPQKVLPTIRSRTQHFEFRLLSSEVLGDLLREVEAKATLGVASEAIDLAVRRGNGSARDALSVLDQVAAAGVVDDDAPGVVEVVDALADRDTTRLLLAVAEALAAGRDARRLGTDVLDHLRNGFLATQARRLVLLPESALARAEDQARRLGLAGVVRAMEVVGEALADMRDSVDPRVTLEVALVRLAYPAADVTVAALAQRLDRLERLAGTAATGSEPPVRPEPPSSSPSPASPAGLRLALGALRRPPGGTSPATGPTAPGPTATGPTAPGPTATGPTTPGPTPSGPAPSRRPPTPSLATPSRASPEAGSPESHPDLPATRPAVAMPGRDDLTAAWGDTILPSLPPRVRAFLAPGRFVAVEGEVAVFGLPDAPFLVRAERVRGEVEAALSAYFARPVRLRLTHNPTEHGSSPKPAAEPADDPSAYDLGELRDAPPASVAPEQRLLEAFPGAKEVLQP
ncbi:MAG: DNA polymerase III subunit gamma/tau [Acidimicrobiales bacterium]